MDFFKSTPVYVAHRARFGQPTVVFKWPCASTVMIWKLGGPKIDWTLHRCAVVWNIQPSSHQYTWIIASSPDPCKCDQSCENVLTLNSIKLWTVKVEKSDLRMTDVQYIVKLSEKQYDHKGWWTSTLHEVTCSCVEKAEFLKVSGRKRMRLLFQGAVDWIGCLTTNLLWPC